LRPIYSFQFPKLFKDISFSSIEDLASYYLQLMFSKQATGPYLIAGWSMGGVVAYEMAKQLEAKGQRVSFLGILDIAPNFMEKTSLTAKQLVSLLLTDQRFGITPNMSAAILAELENVPEHQWLDYVSQGSALAGNSLLAGSQQLLENLAQTLSEGEQLLKSYSITGKVQHISYFRAKHNQTKDEVELQVDQNDKEWQTFSSKTLNVFSIPGNHLTILQLPHVKLIAKNILSSIRELCADIT